MHRQFAKKDIDMRKKIISFFTDEEGATAVEYSIMVAAISAVIISIVYSVGVKVNASFTNFNSLW
jgi:pilus assembly protein Flp/PilA